MTLQADGHISYRANSARLDRAYRKVLHDIGWAETPQDVEHVWQMLGAEIGAIRRDFPQLYNDIEQARQDQILMTRGNDLADFDEASEHGGSRAFNRKENAMANNPDFYKVVVKDVELQWPRLDQTYRYNERDEKTEPCAPTAPGAGWSVAWIMDTEDAKRLWTDLKAHHAQCVSRNNKLPAFTDVFSRKKLENGKVQFTAKKGAMNRDGEPNKQPKIVGPDRQPLEGAEAAIWSGSRGHIRALAFPATNPQDQSGGISLLLDAVQVTHPEYGSDGLGDDFGWDDEDPDFGDTPAQQAATTAAAPADSNLQEEAGF